MKNIFETSDFNLVATLHSLNHKFNEIKREENGRVIFCFTKDARLKIVIKKYQQEELCIEPQKFAYSQKFLKTIIYSDNNKKNYGTT